MKAYSWGKLAVAGSVYILSACSSADSAQTGNVQVNAGGEALSQTGYAYSANPGNEPVFADGWAITFDRYVVVINSVQLNETGTDPTRQDSVGSLVAKRNGPWVVDVHKDGAVAGTSPGETAHPIVTIDAPDGGGTFNVTETYAFSYDIGPATSAAINVNMTGSEDQAVFDQMIAKGWTNYFEGTATYRGRAPTATVDAWAIGFPTIVKFSFGWSAPAKFINCQNPDIGQEDTPANRGVRPKATGSTRAQVTMHTDHFFWDTLNQEGTPLRFDAIAARAQNINGVSTVTLDDLANVAPNMLKDRNGTAVGNRADQTNATYEVTSPPPSYSTNGATAIKDLRDFVVYSARSQGHLNADGLCFVSGAAPDEFLY